MRITPLLFTKIVLNVLIANIAFSQNAPTCHSASPSEFANLAGDKQFIDVHQEPAIQFQEEPAGEMITFPTPDGLTGKGYLVESRQSSKLFLFIFHEWYGLNSHVKNEADRFGESLPDVNVLAIDLYDGKIAENREMAGEYMQAVDNNRALSVISGAAEFTGDEGMIATLGWCFGGGWSLQASLELGSKSKACIIYYGMPEKDTARLAMLQAPVLGIFASKDSWINGAIVNDFENKLETLGKKFQLHTYEAEHGFANPSNSIFDEASTADAWARSLDFIMEYLRE